MYDQVMFSSPCYSDKFYSKMFHKKELLPRNESFQDQWIKFWVGQGVTEVYLSIDGSNIDCESDGNSDATRGKDKSGSHSTIISFMR